MLNQRFIYSACLLGNNLKLYEFGPKRKRERDESFHEQQASCLRLFWAQSHILRKQIFALVVWIRTHKPFHFVSFINGFIVIALRTIEMWISKVNIAFWDI